MLNAKTLPSKIFGHVQPCVMRGQKRQGQGFRDQGFVFFEVRV